MQKEHRGFKIVKLRTSTVAELDKLMEQLTVRQPYLETGLSYNIIIQMLLMKNTIKLSKRKFVIADDEGSVFENATYDVIKDKKGNTVGFKNKRSRGV